MKDKRAVIIVYINIKEMETCIEAVEYDKAIERMGQLTNSGCKIIKVER